MTDLQMWELIVGFLSATFVLPMVQQPHWTVRTRASVTFVYAVVVGLVTAYLVGAFAGVHDFRTGVSSVLLMLVTAIASYRGFAKPTGIAPTIERATSPNQVTPGHRTE
jgi:hypothetical protein